jgi:hypothetical protein
VSDTYDARVGQDFVGGQRVAELSLGMRSGNQVLDVALVDALGPLASRRTNVVVEGTVSVTVVISRRDAPPCDADSDCRSAASCAEGRCYYSTCLQVPIEGACAEGSYCSIDDGGCRPLPGVEPPPPVPCTTHAECGPGEQCHDGECLLATAFRIDQMTLLDPHLFAGASAGMCFCFDGTSVINDRIQSDIAGLSRNLLHVFIPLDLGSERNRMVGYGNATCASETSCTLSGDFVESQATLTREGTTPCYEAPADTLGGYGTPSAPPPPCFVSDPSTLAFFLDPDSPPLDFIEGRVSGTWSGDPPDRIVGGLMAGFVTEDAARAAVLPPEVGSQICGDPSLYTLLKGGGSCQGGDDRDDLDGDGTPDGWWFYFAFEGQRVDWSE